MQETPVSIAALLRSCGGNGCCGSLILDIFFFKQE